MPDPLYTLTLTIKNVTDGDVIDLAQRIWEENAHDLDAKLGDFTLHASRDGFALDWEPDAA